MTSDGARRIRDLLRPFPARPLAIKPTPIRVMSGLSAALGPDRKAWVMRDDLTGFALGGNKIRKLEYLIGDALARKVDALVVAGACSFSRNAAAAGRSAGLDVHVLIAGDPADQNPLSREFFELVGARVHYVATGRDLREPLNELIAALRADGHVVQELVPGGSDELGTLGYVEAFAEILEWMAREDIVFQRIFHASGSAATQAGLLLGQAISRRDDMRIVGVAISQIAEIQAGRVAKLALATAAMLGVEFDPSRVVIEDGYLGEGYPIPSADSRAAVERFAKEDGLLFDPVYVGKAAAAVLGQARRGNLDGTTDVLLIHTGGNAGAYY